MEHMCTKFGVDSSSRFPFRVRTNRQTDIQTDTTERPTHAGGYTPGMSKNYLQLSTANIYIQLSIHSNSINS